MKRWKMLRRRAVGAKKKKKSGGRCARRDHRGGARNNGPSARSNGRGATTTGGTPYAIERGRRSATACVTGSVGGGKRRVRRRLGHALVGYDPVAAYVAALERTWGRAAAFFVDPLGGTAVGVVWRGDGDTAFGINRTVFTAPVGVVRPGGWRGTAHDRKRAKQGKKVAPPPPGAELGGVSRLVWNTDEMLWAMVTLGGELVAGVRRRGVDW